MDEVLAVDFLFLLDMCPQHPFPANSNEEYLAEKWLNYLCTYEVKDLADRRLKNIYISHLAAALIQRKLYGPFLREPQSGRLKKTDFLEEADCCCAGEIKPQRAVASQSIPHAITNLNISRNMAGGGIDDPLSVDSPNLGFNAASGSASVQTICSCPRCPAEANRTQDRTPAQMKAISQISFHGSKPKNTPPPDQNAITAQPEASSSSIGSEEIIENIKVLLLAISAELKGDAEPGSSEFLDYELVRYKNFVTANFDLADYFRNMSCMNLRHYLLIRLQNDLIKLLKAETSQLIMQPESA